MLDLILIAVLLLLLFAGLVHMKKHFQGGGCCGGGNTTIRDKKALTAPKLGEKHLRIEGMHCENCAIRVENGLNRLEGVVCRVNLRKKTAVVSYSQEVSDALLKETVEHLGYQVTACVSKN